MKTQATPRTLFRTLRLWLTALLLLLSPIPSWGKNPSEVDSLLTTLDRVIDNQQTYIQQKYDRLWELKQQIAHDNPKEALLETFEHYRQLTEEYIPFRFDSAYYYASNTLRLARQLGDQSAERECQIQMANILMTGGLFAQAFEVLDSLRSPQMDQKQQAQLYSMYDLTLLLSEKFSGGGFLDSKNQRLKEAYLDSLSRVVSYTPDNYRMISRLYIEREEPDIAKIRLKELLDQLPVGTRAHAIVASSLAYCYEINPEGDLRKEYLIRSAISDIMGAVRENESLRQLSYLLFEEGDIQRAHDYISISINDANFYNARLRSIEAASTYPIIQKAYREMRNKGYFRLQITILVALLLLLFSLIIAGILRNRLRALREARRELAHRNQELKALNETLSDSSHLKQEQLVSFLVLCSSYINKLERYQLMVHNLLTLGKVAQLKEQSGSSTLINSEIRAFYESFDKMVLRLFPDLVSHINSLLKPEEQIHLQNEGLTTELRIYALICLGITDSSQIARFLRYSSNTVYTYRTKIRNKAQNKETFDEDIRRIGLY